MAKPHRGGRQAVGHGRVHSGVVTRKASRGEEGQVEEIHLLEKFNGSFFKFKVIIDPSGKEKYPADEVQHGL